MTIAITGATGQLGRIVIEQLKAVVPADQIVALVRSPEKAADLGVEARAFDYDAPETLVSALVGVDKLLLISGSDLGKRVAQHTAVIAAAKEAGVGFIAYTSLLHADTNTLSLAPEHVGTEQALAASGIPRTLLRNGWYTENYTMSLPAAVQHNALIGSAGEGRISSASRADYAAAAVAVLSTEGHAGKTYELSGDSDYSLSELAAEVSKQTGKDIPYVNLPEADYTAALVQAELPEGFAAALASFDVEASKGALYDKGKTLSDLIGRPTTPLSEVVAAALS
ncbi:SDR family oxidoreductase [Donghicola sp. C2-DW-16]|uniref:SDR family oxidoreductase n=1 Tax=Donghicola mangrovi TaxID=2729614 RepID=A0ABX2PGU7_9RHOB|nr:SDR family oxidoreductase [Donghicola mangrovi]NVO28723.1 SDR family oxidoreductase [Donghicola mangrovi]